MANLGRPPIWDDSDAFAQAVDDYFDDIDQVHTWTGLAIHLGFESRQSLEDYKDKPGFSYPIKKALLRIEEIYEKALFNKNAAGPIFALKNFGWRDRQEIDQKTDHSGVIQHNIDYSKLSDSALLEIEALEKKGENESFQKYQK
jgi:hypothetical protein